MLPIYIDRNDYGDNVPAIHNLGFAINYITTALGSVLINRLVSYIYDIDNTDENDSMDMDLSLALAERGEYNKNITQKSVEEIIENGEYTVYRIL